MASRLKGLALRMSPAPSAASVLPMLPTSAATQCARARTTLKHKRFDQPGILDLAKRGGGRINQPDLLGDEPSPRQRRAKRPVERDVTPFRRKAVTLRHARKRKQLLAKVRTRRLRAKKKAAKLLEVGATNYEELIEALKQHRRKLGITQEQLNDIAGFQDGYVNKLEVGYKEGGRGVGSMSLPTWLQSLGVKLLVVPR